MTILDTTHAELEDILKDNDFDRSSYRTELTDTTWTRTMADGSVVIEFEMTPSGVRVYRTRYNKHDVQVGNMEEASIASDMNVTNEVRHLITRH